MVEVGVWCPSEDSLGGSIPVEAQRGAGVCAIDVLLDSTREER
jgi:hypothetical protein